MQYMPHRNITNKKRNNHKTIYNISQIFIYNKKNLKNKTFKICDAG